MLLYSSFILWARIAQSVEYLQHWAQYWGHWRSILISNRIQMRRESRWRTNEGEGPFPVALRQCYNHWKWDCGKGKGSSWLHFWAGDWSCGPCWLSGPSSSGQSSNLHASHISFLIQHLPQHHPRWSSTEQSRNNYHGQVPLMLSCPIYTLLSSLIGQLQLGFPLASVSNPSCG